MLGELNLELFFIRTLALTRRSKLHLAGFQFSKPLVAAVRTTIPLYEQSLSPGLAYHLRVKQSRQAVHISARIDCNAHTIFIQKIKNSQPSLDISPPGTPPSPTPMLYPRFSPWHISSLEPVHPIPLVHSVLLRSHSSRQELLFLTPLSTHCNSFHGAKQKMCSI